MRYYFAFGSNMARTTLVERGVRARRAGAGFVPNYRLAFTLPSQRWTGRAADLVPATGHQAWGVLWEMNDPNALDPFERRYDRRSILVTPSGAEPGSEQTVDAFTYTVKAKHRATGEDLPAPAYLERMLAGALEAELPSSYVRFLEGFRP
ncbi:MAG: gamma-glutamylcyclotransferase family protein [Acidimicrobiia bacterium]|nr:gamma-glutamylcyclotransferase family protein [Acidimicrobiia bacterium]